LPLIVLVWVVRGWLQIVAAHTGGGEGFFNGLLVPKHAVVDCPEAVNKVEEGYYDGHVDGYGGVVDAR
jgi:hypothetical protein